VEGVASTRDIWRVIRVRPPSVRLPFDLARLALEETLRGGLPADEPEILRFLGGIGWRFEQRLTPTRARLTAEEVRRTFGGSARQAGAIIREAQDLALQARMEALVLPRMAAAHLDQVVRVDGSLAPPALVLFPHAGNVLLLVAALARRWPGLVVFGPRGLPPAAPGVAVPTRIDRHLAQRRLEDEARLPIRWESDPAALPAWLAAGHLVAAAFDDRAWPTYVDTPFLDRVALLSDDPYRIARAAGVPVIPATIRRERDKTSRVTLGAPVDPSLPAYLAAIEPFLRAYPGHYARWLAECRMRAGVDDHPLFTDYDRTAA
jgi:lauroyl/myristoyl acyltransferase